MIGRNGWPGGPAAALLAGPELLYRGVISLRNALYDADLLRPRALPCVAISVGNLTVGGTGKTPLTSYLAGILRDSGYRVGVLSRGYRGRRQRGPLLVSDGRSVLGDADAAGDEPFLIARDNPGVPVAVGPDREAAARLLCASCPSDVLILDDAFQHRRVARDVNLLLVDGRDPWGNGRMMPRGPLREPLASASRADAFVVTRSEGRRPAALEPVLDRFNRTATVFLGRVEPRGFVRADGETVASTSLKGMAAYAFCGIARPERFEEDLRNLGVRIAGSLGFPHHHRFRRPDLEAVARGAAAASAEVLVTTEKDLVRLSHAPPLGPPLYALAQRLVFQEGPDLQAFVLDRLAALGPRPARR